MNKKHRVKKRNNKGLTLVEVIVAIAVLSVAILPLLYAFVYTSKFNMKSREKQRATSAAQAIVEKYKAYPIQEIENSFSAAASPQPFEVGNGSLVRNGGVVETEYNITTTGSTTNYVIRNMKYVSGATTETATYDALISVTRRDDTYVGDFFKYIEEDTLNDAVYRISEDYDELAYEEAKREVQTAFASLAKDPTSPTFTADDIKKIHFKRSVEIVITKNASNGVYTVTPTLKYVYSLPSSENVKYKDTAGNWQVFTVAQAFTTLPDMSTIFPDDGLLYNNASTVSSGASLKNLYIYFFPIYSLTCDESALEDAMTIKNNTGEHINVYLYKQNRFGYTTANIRNLENFSANKNRIKVTFEGTSVNLYHNLDMKLGDSSDVKTPNSVDLSSMLFGSYTRKYVVAPSSPVATPTPTYFSSDILDDIEVKIYRHGALNLDGTVADANGLLSTISATYNGKK